MIVPPAEAVQTQTATQKPVRHAQLGYICNLMDQAAAEIMRIRIREAEIRRLAVEAHRLLQEHGDRSGFVRLAAYLEGGEPGAQQTATAAVSGH